MSNDTESKAKPIKTHQDPTDAEPAKDPTRIPGQGVGGHAKPGKPDRAHAGTAAERKV